MLGLYGGAFDPPHRGHVALARRAKEKLELDRLIVLVAAAPGHKRVDTASAVRLSLARSAFPDDEVLLDEHPRTIDTLRAHPEWSFDSPVFLLGADQFCELPSWKEPEEVLRLAKLGVATRPGFPRERLDDVLAVLTQPERVLFFDLEPIPVASSDVRERVAAGLRVDDLVPAAVAALIRADGLYRGRGGYTQSA